MGDQIIRDKRNRRICAIKTDLLGNQTIYDPMNRKMAVIKIDSAGRQVLYDTMNKKKTYYDPKLNLTKDMSNRTIGKGNILLDLVLN